jgi:biotin operon repressor
MVNILLIQQKGVLITTMSQIKRSKSDCKQISGINEISKHLNISKNTVIKMIKNEGLPATKIQHKWYSNTDLINFWFLNRIKKNKK